MPFSLVRKKTGMLEAARDALLRLFDSRVDTPVLFLTSGGSALSLLDFDAPPNISALGLVDERYTANAADRNITAFRKTRLCRSAEEKKIPVFEFDQSLPLEVAALTYEANVRKWRQENPKGEIVVSLGMGVDAHTGGIFPFPESPEQFESIFGGHAWVAGYDTAQNEFNARLTVSPHFLINCVDAAVSYCSGAGKKAALGRVLDPEGAISDTPARLLTMMKHVEMFSDIL